MIVVGLTGGIGSGSRPCRALLARRGAVIIDADAIVHELQRPERPLLEELAARFGGDIISDDGALDRGRLAELAFTDDDAVSDLNAIVHPAVRAEIARRVEALRRDRHRRRARHSADHRAGRLSRGCARRGRRPDRGRSRAGRRRAGDVRGGCARPDGHAAPRERRLEIADRVIDNSGDLDALERQVDDVWAWMHTLPPQPS